jgi:hypothetical protein
MDSYVENAGMQLMHRRISYGNVVLDLGGYNLFTMVFMLLKSRIKY